MTDRSPSRDPYTSPSLRDAVRDGVVARGLVLVVQTDSGAGEDRVETYRALEGGDQLPDRLRALAVLVADSPDGWTETPEGRVSLVALGHGESLVVRRSHVRGGESRVSLVRVSNRQGRAVLDDSPERERRREFARRVRADLELELGPRDASELIDASGPGLARDVLAWAREVLTEVAPHTALAAVRGVDGHRATPQATDRARLLAVGHERCDLDRPALLAALRELGIHLPGSGDPGGNTLGRYLRGLGVVAAAALDGTLAEPEAA